MIKVVKSFVQGTVFGITGIVPAVSGGTIAIILGFYNEVIEAINHFKEDRPRYLRFLLPLVFGIIAGLVLFSSVIHYLLTNYSFPTMMFFIGLIAGTIPSIYTKIKTPDRFFGLKEIIIILAPIIVLLIISGIRPVSAVNPVEVISNIDILYILFLFFAGIITGAALVIPGVSGSYIQLLFGIYPLVTYTLSSFRFIFTGRSLLVDCAKVLAPLTAGMIIGGFLMVKLIGRLLTNHFKTTYLVIFGLLLGSIYTLFKEPIVFQSGMSAQIVIIGIIILLPGFFISFYSGKKNMEEGKNNE